jgi:hypothetical protein
VLKLPSVDVNAAAGSQTWHNGNAQGVVGQTIVFGSNSQQTTIFRDVPTITTTATPAAYVGQPITDSANLSGGTNPTGTITFSLYGPNNATCTGAPIFPSTQPVSGNGTVASGPFTPTAPGTYRWVAAYSGDPNNVAVTSGCNAPNETTLVRRNVVADFDGDNDTDVSIFRTSDSTWYLRTNSPQAVVWGAPGDIHVPGDYDGNGTTDVAVYRPGNATWYLRTAAPFSVVWGAAGDIPVPADYNGDGITDVAVYRPGNGTWYVRTPTPFSVVWGAPGDVPVPGDYNADGTFDVAVYRPGNGTWYVRTPTPFSAIWGGGNDVPVPGDYDGDGDYDVAIYRRATGQWFIQGGGLITWGGGAGDIPVPGDYDANGTTDAAVYRGGTWFVRSASPFAVVWGGPTPPDQPLLLPYAIRQFMTPPAG